MKTFILEHKKLCIAILAMLLVLIVLLLCWVFRPKLSTLSDWELELFLMINRIESKYPLNMEGLRNFIRRVEDNPYYIPVISSTEIEIWAAKLNKAVNRYYGKPFVYQYILDGE